MTARNSYMDLCLAVQAIRRSVERVRTPLAPAIGVASSIYTHQLANTLRVLSDLRVRHLLADEVGLGKTVQALMVLNALKDQRSSLRALVIVPDQLVPQWRDEILTRAHTAPIGDDVGARGAQYIRLAWESQLKSADEKSAPAWSLTDIDSANYDVLVIDELHRLTAEVQDRIVRTASSFEHLLILTATPAFRRQEGHAQLFAILEPERSAIARWRCVLRDDGVGATLSVRDDLSKWPEWAMHAVAESILERDRAAAASCSTHSARVAAALCNCAYRRVIRTRRVDYSGVLPRRRHIPIVTEPIAAEAERQALMWRYFGHLGKLSRQFDPILLAKRVILSPPSLEQRVDFLRRKGHERDGLLERVKPLVHRSQGDSRLDALVDLLADVWALDPQERVLVAAQDTLTVDYLFDVVQARLPLIGPLQRRVSLVAARMRQGMMTDAVEDIAGFGNETNDNLEAFQRGEAHVLFAPETAQVGLNLQCARVLVLYSVPWRPEEVEQWIGRLDRIGNAAAFSAEGSAKFIDVYTIAQRGLVDEKVVTVLQRFHVFERGANLDGDHLEKVSELIEAAALRPGSVNWRELEDATEVMAAQDQVQELDSPLRPSLPWSVEWAASIREQIDAMKPVAPVLVALPEHLSSGPRSWDCALEGLVKLLQRAGEYHIRWHGVRASGGFRTLWYRFGEASMYGHRETLSQVIFSFGANPADARSPRHAHAFITRRGDLETPPCRSVNMILDGEEIWRPLHFLNFGDPLHDELVNGWAQRAERTITIDVALFEDHALFSARGPGDYLLRLSVLDPAAALTDRGVKERALEGMTHAASTTTAERLPEFLRPYVQQLCCALEADARWARAQLSAELRIDAMRYSSGHWIRITAGEVAALLNPMAHGRDGVPHSTARQTSPEDVRLISAALEQLRAADSFAARDTWSHRLPTFDCSLALRRHAVREEARDAEELSTLELEDAKRQLRLAGERGNQAQITRAAITVGTKSDALAITQALWAARESWLEEFGEAIRNLRPSERLSAAIRVHRVQ